MPVSSHIERAAQGLLQRGGAFGNLYVTWFRKRKWRPTAVPKGHLIWTPGFVGTQQGTQEVGTINPVHYLDMNVPKTMCCPHVELFREGGKNFTSSDQTAGKQVSGSFKEPYLILFPLCHGLRTSLTTCSQLPKTMLPGHRQNPLKLQAKINPSSFKLGFQVF